MMNLIPQMYEQTIVYLWIQFRTFIMALMGTNIIKSDSFFKITEDHKDIKLNCKSNKTIRT